MGGGDVRKRKGGGTKSEPEPNKTTASSVPEQKKSEVTAPTSPVDLQCVLILCTLSILAILVSMGVLGPLLVSFEGQFSAGFTTSSSHHHEGPRSRARAPREHRTQDLQVHVQISLEDVYFGHTVHFPRLRTIVCSTCDGSGMREGAEVITCPHCRGQGFEVFKQRMGHITFDQRVQCSHCGGAGASVDAVITQITGIGLPDPSASQTPAPSPTRTPEPSASRTPAPSPSRTPAPSVTPTPSRTPSPQCTEICNCPVFTCHLVYDFDDSDEVFYN